MTFCKSESMTDPIDPQKHLRRMWETAPKLAKAKALRVALEEGRKSLKAVLMKSSGVEAIGAQERDAYAHEDYKAHLDKLSKAVEEEEVMRLRFVTDQASVEVWRSQESSNRAMDRGTR